MCGIAGIIKFSSAPPSWHPPQNNRAALTAMSNALALRGPDGSGLYVDPRPDKTAALLHRRLAIIDLPCGHQPMANETQDVHVVFNGEIYNHAELRRTLQSPANGSHKFSTDHSDTEVLLHGYEQWGTELPAKLRGMFAFALWDTRPDPATGLPRDTLFLARDRLGQKPLFYASLDDGIVFASNIPALLAWPEVPRRTSREQLALYLQFGYLPSPQTIWRDISQVSPGGWVRLRRDVFDGGIYWRPQLTADPKFQNESTAAAALRDHVTRSVESQLIADVPIACFLSGGIDSSIIADTMQQIVSKNGGPPIHTVSVGFSNSSAEAAYDETTFAAAVAKKIGSRHTRLEVNATQNSLDTLQRLMQNALGQPFADSSILPTYHLSQAVRQIAPVALSGDGADELFAGYDRYRAMTLLARWQTFAPFLPKSAPVGSLSKRERYRRLAAAAKEKSLPDRYTRLTELFPPGLLQSLLGEASPYIPPEISSSIPHPSPFRYAMLRDQLEYMPGDVLYKVDSASMMHALEVRSPFLDHDLAAFANTLPDNLLHNGTSKYLLRHTFADALPPEVRTRTKKGFAIPIGHWFRTTLRDPLHAALLSSSSYVSTHLHRPTLETLLHEHHTATRDHTHRLFALLTLELWAQQFHPS